MSSFTSPLIVIIHTATPRERELYADFVYVTNAGWHIAIPAGFKTDFASVPRALWALLPPLDHYGKAAVVHDYLYRTHNVGCTRLVADKILKEACEVLGVKRWKIGALYLAVRAFGWLSWKE